ncbi:MAG: polysaccharide deacetylase family protein [Bacteroidota bacterium]
MLRRGNINACAIILLALLGALHFAHPVPYWMYLAVLAAWFVVTTLGSFYIQWNYHLRSIHSNKTAIKNQVSLTFDDGPHPEFTPKVLELLRQYNAKATFFLIGKEAGQHPKLVQDILGQGHSIGNHTYSHTNFFGFLATSKVISELERTNAILKKITGRSTRLYRPAFGVTNPNIQKAVKVLNLVSVGWNVRSLDTTQRSEEAVLQRITSKISKGDIILLHDTSQKTVKVLEQLLLFLVEKKLQCVTVDELLNIKAYE